jgi:hypothetical protein
MKVIPMVGGWRPADGEYPMGDAQRRADWSVSSSSGSPVRPELPW